MEPVCVKCWRRMKCHKNGQIIQEKGHGDEGFRHGDVWICLECGMKVIVGFGDRISRKLVTPSQFQELIVVE